MQLFSFQHVGPGVWWHNPRPYGICSRDGTYCHKTLGRCELETQARHSRRVFFPGCRWRTRWLRTPPTVRSSPPCWLELRGARPSHGTSLNSPWRLYKVEFSRLLWLIDFKADFFFKLWLMIIMIFPLIVLLQKYYKEKKHRCLFTKTWPGHCK